MKVIKQYIGGPILLEPKVNKDERGYFFESFNNEQFKKDTGLDITFVQDNESKSNYGVLRGLHFQVPPYDQSKLVRVIKGAVFDYIVDLRKGSQTYGQFCGEYLSEENHRMFFVPRGFAHGFITLRDNTIFQYKCDNYYKRSAEGGLLWNTPLPIGNSQYETEIPWTNYVPYNDIILSEKDRYWGIFKEFDSPFEIEKPKEEDSTTEEKTQD